MNEQYKFIFEAYYPGIAFKLVGFSKGARWGETALLVKIKSIFILILQDKACNIQQWKEEFCNDKE